MTIDAEVSGLANATCPVDATVPCIHDYTARRKEVTLHTGGGAAENPSFVPMLPGMPTNMPDDETDGKNYVFVHGYSVNADRSRTWARAMFKRLRWAGLKSKFTAVDWFGDDSQITVPIAGDVSPGKDSHLALDLARGLLLHYGT